MRVRALLVTIWSWIEVCFGSSTEVLILHRSSFIPRWFLTIGLFVSLFSGHSATAITKQSAVAETTPPKWYRHVFQIQKPREFNTSVGVSAPTDCRVWLNGQLLRSEAVEESLIVFEVSRLIRNGANCLAVESQAKDAELPVALLRNGQPFSSVNWRMKTTEPPVGWQKTDFNDKNWQAVKPVSKRADWAAVPVRPFMSKTEVSRFENGQFRFRDHDHVALLGGTFIERAQQFGHLEAALMSSEADGLTFRNLGWSADTVFAESRGIFDSPAKGYARMIEHLRAEEPDVVIIAYGQNEAMQEASGDDAVRFRQQFQRLISDVRTTGAEVVLVTPHAFLSAPAPLPDARLWNPTLRRYAEMVEDIADKSGCHCVNLFDDFDQRLMQAAEVVGFWPFDLQADEHQKLRDHMLHSLSSNGMHWNERGYRCLSTMFANALFRGANTDSQERPSADYVHWDVASLADEQTSPARKSVSLKLQRPWLKPGILVVHTGDNWESIVSHQAVLDEKRLTLPQLPSRELSGNHRFQIPWQYDQLVQLLVRKNELYFHRWRPQNITYLFGFRKHEQGNNASDIAEFDPLIVELEQQIQTLRNSDGPTLRLELK